MYDQEKIKPYNSQDSKGEQVARMFDNIAHSYDRLNHLLSFGIDKGWRKAALNTLLPYKPQSILDVATGTGDFAILAAKMLKPQKLTAVDISEGMLSVGRDKVHKEGLGSIIEMKQEDCMHFSFADNSFDAITVAYGVRNFENLDQGLKEMLRVLKPGGHLVIIELCTPNQFPMKQLFKLYAGIVMPLIGRTISKDTNAYEYLPATMKAFPQGEAMQRILQNNGYREAKFKRFTCGISTLYTATK